MGMGLRAILIALLLCGCETDIFEHGQLVARIQGDCTNVTIRTSSGGYFHADTLNHSIPTTAAMSGTAKTVGALGSAVTSAILAAP